MNPHFVINLVNYKLNKAHPYTIFFEATCPGFREGKFELEYCVTDLRCNLPLVLGNENKILQEMVKKFGYGPFNKQDVKQALGICCQIRIEEAEECEEER